MGGAAGGEVGGEAADPAAPDEPGPAEPTAADRTALLCGIDELWQPGAARALSLSGCERVREVLVLREAMRLPLRQQRWLI